MQTDSRTEHPDRFEVLGKITWLWMNSPLHSDWAVHLATRFLLPAVESGQFELIERDGLPVAYCSWAWLSPQAELAYLVNPSRVLSDNWRSGDRLWFIDWVAPFAATDSWNLRRAMMQRFPDEVARAIRVKREKSRARVMEFKGPRLNSGIAHARLKNYYDDFLSVARQQTHPCAGNLQTQCAADEVEEHHHG